MNEEHHHRRFELSPIFIGLLGIMAGTMVVATYHCIAVGCCNRRRRLPDPPVSAAGPPTPLRRPQLMNNIVLHHQQERRPSNNDVSRNENSLQNNSVLLEKAQECRLEGSCAVCLSEFNEGEEEIKVLPQCSHCFHAQCVNVWLYTHANCPLCRAQTSPPPPHVISMLNYGGGASSHAQLPRVQGVADHGGSASFRP